MLWTPQYPNKHKQRK